MQQRLHVNRLAPRRGQVKFDVEIVSGNTERRGGKGRRVDALTLLVQALPVDLPVIRQRPQADVTELSQPDAAAHEVLVGVPAAAAADHGRARYDKPVLPKQR